jgi:hypothetical protein
MSRDPLLMLDSKIQMLDRCVRIDERLAAVRTARPITPGQYARLRNGYVFHEVGACAAAGQLAAHAPAVLDRLVAGGLDPFVCAQNFVRGWYHDRGPRGVPPTRDEIAAALDACRDGLAAHGYASRAGEIADAAERVFANRHDLRWLAGAVHRRLRRVAAEVAARPRLAPLRPAPPGRAG